MIDQNANAAARRCGYAPGSCRAQGAALLRDTRIRERVTDGLEELFERLDVTEARVLGDGHGRRFLILCA
jgi:phage terminase small subunit